MSIYQTPVVALRIPPDPCTGLRVLGPDRSRSHRDRRATTANFGAPRVRNLPPARFANTFSATFTTPTVECGNKMPATLPAVFKRGSKRRSRFVITRELALSDDDKKRATAVVAECRIGRSGTLRTACNGKPPAESGAAVPTSGARSDTEPGSPDRNKRGASSPERGRSE
jgi:hypothetical protein